MRRRAFILATASAGFFSAEGAGQRVWRVGVLETTGERSNEKNFNALRRGLEAVGYVEGRNLSLEYRSADGQAERFPALAADLIGLNVDVIITRGTPAVLAAMRATSTTPIVMAASGEPSETGIVASLAHPGANVTGLSSFNTSLELKRVELLREVLPNTRRLAGLYNLGNPVLGPRWELVKGTALAQGLEARVFDVRAPADIEQAFRSAVNDHFDALTVGMDALTQAHSRAIADMATHYRLPAVYPSREFVDQGGLLAYSVSYPDLYFRAAAFVDKIFRGAKPAELPVEQPTTFEFVVNLKAAKALGITIPPSIVLRADEVIE